MTKLQTWGAVALALLIVGVLGYCSGVKKGGKSVALQSIRDSLSVVVGQSKAIQQQRDVLANALHEQLAKTAQAHTVYVHDKTKLTLKGDTAVTKDSSQVLLPEVAQQLRDADIYIAKLVAENASLWFALQTDSTLIANQAEQIRLNQNIAKMVEGSRFSSGVQVGVGVCATPNGTAPCVYVGYGGQFKMP